MNKIKKKVAKVSRKGGNSNLVVDSAAQRSQMSGFARFAIFKMAMSGVDFFGAWLGTKIEDGFVVNLRSKVSDLLGASMAKAKDSILMVEGRVVYAWNVKTVGDVYVRKHIDDTSGKSVDLRGSLETLRKTYGAKNVQLVSMAQLVKIAASKKIDKGCALALGMAKTATAKVAASNEGNEDDSE